LADNAATCPECGNTEDNFFAGEHGVAFALCGKCGHRWNPDPDEPTRDPTAASYADYQCDRCPEKIGTAGKVRRSRTDGIVLTALCAACLKAGASLRFGP
jgi:Zn ribbon nucleic-acid-binding protein